jgi:hypothetical protein
VQWRIVSEGELVELGKSDTAENSLSSSGLSSPHPDIITLLLIPDIIPLLQGCNQSLIDKNPIIGCNERLKRGAAQVRLFR